MDDLRKRKLAHNEVLFREVNETIAQTRASSEATRYICECSDQHCALTIELAREEYERIRSHDTWFFILPGHEQPEVERVIESHGDYLVVEKTVPIPES